MSDSIRLSKYRALYTGKYQSDPKLRLKSTNDRTSLAYMRTHHSVNHIANVQRSNHATTNSSTRDIRTRSI